MTSGYIYFAWVTSLLAVTLSLIFSEILHYTPCSLCWYQRIAMYPTAFILTMAVIRRDQNIIPYILPLSIFGALIAFYHSLLQYGIISQVTPCGIGVDCTTKYLDLFGFITIPLMSFLAFSIISFSMLFFLRKYEKRT